MRATNQDAVRRRSSTSVLRPRSAPERGASAGRMHGLSSSWPAARGSTHTLCVQDERVSRAANEDDALPDHRRRDACVPDIKRRVSRSRRTAALLADDFIDVIHVLGYQTRNVLWQASGQLVLQCLSTCQERLERNGKVGHVSTGLFATHQREARRTEQNIRPACTSTARGGR
jgi:hypothetical protein